jgi:HlyD family secretion protein
VNTATKNLNTVLQNIASQKLSLAQFSSQLALLAAGTSPTDLSSQEAQVAVAEANVLGLKALVLQGKANVGSVEAKYVHTEIVAPISGTITQFDAKVGEEAAQSVPLVSIMSTGGYEVDSGVSETDLGKIAVGNFATMTIDAFPGETFPGKVFYIAPAETNTLGVVSYQVKISFAHADPRMKSGLSTTITIETKHKDNVLILPQYAILQNDKGTFVETLLSGVVKENPVTLGISDQSGHVEIETGVSEGEVVLNIGLKTP